MASSTVSPSVSSDLSWVEVTTADLMTNCTSTLINCTMDEVIQGVTTNDTSNQQMYRPISSKLLATFIFGLILIIGFLGNMMVVIVVSITRTMKTPTNCYLVSLAIADMTVLMCSIPIEIVSYYVREREWVFGDVGCHVLIFCQYLGINSSSMCITAFTIERYIAICHPLTAQKMCTVHRAKRIIYCVWCFACVYTSPWLLLTRVVPFPNTTYNTCTMVLDRNSLSYKISFASDMILFYILPLIVSCILYALIARILFSDNLSRSMRSTGGRTGGVGAGVGAGAVVGAGSGAGGASGSLELSSKLVIPVSSTGSGPKRCFLTKSSSSNHWVESTSFTQPNGDSPHHHPPVVNEDMSTCSDRDSCSIRESSGQNRSMAPPASLVPPSSTPESTTYGSNNHRSCGGSASDYARVQVVKMLAVVVGVFALCWLPYRGLLLYNSFVQQSYLAPWFLMLSKMLIFINSAINPVLYSAMSIKFRNAFKKLLLCGDGDAHGRNGGDRNLNLTYTGVSHRQVSTHGAHGHRKEQNNSMEKRATIVVTTCAPTSSIGVESEAICILQPLDVSTTST